jgi:GDPmannose 4,6-dehydratase
VDQLLGDYSKAKQRLGWGPKISIYELINMMVDHDFNLAQIDKIIDTQKNPKPIGSSSI